MKETDLFFPIKKWMEVKGYTVYAEVQLWAGGRIVDCFGLKNGELVAVELKTSLGITVLRQAYENKITADYSWVAVPFKNLKNNSNKNFCHMIARSFGLGIVYIYPESHKISCSEAVQPKLNKINIKENIIPLLNDGHKKCVGGMSNR